MVSILVLSCNFQQQSTTTADNFHQLPVAIPVSSNNGSEESYGSRPGSTEAAGMGPGLPVSSSARITADHMNGNFSPRNAAGITGRILNTCIYKNVPFTFSIYKYMLSASCARNSKKQMYGN